MVKKKIRLCGHSAGYPVRGVCYRCYARLCGQVRNKKTTWEALIAEGKCLASKRPAEEIENVVIERLRKFTEDLEAVDGDLNALVAMGYRVTKVPQ